ncbi:MAG TPA: SipW-dependent-type signal peptide-containing protein, partial [Solirubrobacterales bacterium]|nr:SipW-dependent-type signal peptide-containing protein [Solirubrobacterales bacterium]
MSRNAKRYLMLLAAIGLIAVVAGGGSGTFASFNAEVENAGNTISTGTLFLHDTAGGVTCTSESATNNANLGTGDNCHTIFNASLTSSSATTYYAVTLKNAGTLNASDISVYSPTGGCTSAPGAYLSNGTLDTTLSGAQTSITIDNLVYGMPTGTVLKIGTDTFTTSEVAQPGSSVTVTGSGTINENSGTAVQFQPSFGSGDLCSGLDMEII